ncbi:polymorphic toxin-type HINT domain-containing protein [Streptomyces bauhiniae]|uniref:Intein C-terminal splicing domain-containing protein n=1 Tax=Streptomyces bauhiniae TaxID=2340725 RepID=A0A7K3QW78_9ACTN|nr:polymorphic toxin-type HINT domain-containing protein [Streptomyces bauhiniae]NEB94075.1 hypothetical protein [Streptomyces bauhiniae]
MADGTAKAIDHVKVGDTIANSVPGAKGTEAHKVTAVIVTHTDHDFVDLAIKKAGGKRSVKSGAKSLAKKAARKAAFGLAASAAVLGALSAAHGHGDTHPATAPVAAVTKASSTAHLTTTFHHPFYDETQSAFVDAKDLEPGDVLQTPTGTAQVTGVRLYHANTTNYDLTIGTLHTYYVDAGDIPVLVHNCFNAEAEHAQLPKWESGQIEGRWAAPGRASEGIKSGEKSSPMARNACEFLKNKLQQSGMLRGGVPGNYSHVEQKLVARMFDEADPLDEVDVVINHTGGPCPEDLGCNKVLDDVLHGSGKTMRVHWRDAAGEMKCRMYGIVKGGGGC